MAKLALALNVGVFLEQLSSPADTDLAPEIITELILQTAPPPGGERAPSQK
jgi:hypothetical protein